MYEFRSDGMVFSVGLFFRITYKRGNKRNRNRIERQKADCHGL